jgi:hypothetical protein
MRRVVYVRYGVVVRRGRRGDGSVRRHGAWSSGSLPVLE